MKRGLVGLLASACLVLLLTAASAPTKRGDDCTWGASSVTATMVDGQLVESQPQTSGCIPNP